MRIWPAVFLLLLPLPAVAASCNAACQARKAEAALRKPGLAERHGNRLVLTTKAGRQVFTDNQQACDTADTKACAVYSLVANVPGSLAVEQFQFEGSDSWLIDTRTGRKTELTGVSVFSPDGREFLVTKFSNESDNNLEIWRRTGDGATLEWAYPFKRAYAEDPGLKEMYEARVQRWNGDHITLALAQGSRHWTGTLTRDAKGWHLSARAPQVGISASP